MNKICCLKVFSLIRVKYYSLAPVFDLCFYYIYLLIIYYEPRNTILYTFFKE